MSIKICQRLKFWIDCVAEEISKQPSTDSAVWLLLLINNEKGFTKQVKLQNVQIEEKRGTRKWNGSKLCSKRCKQIKKSNKGNGGLRARTYPAKLPICEKESKNSLGPGLAVNTFNPITQKAKAGRSLSLRSACSTDGVSG